MTKSTKNLKSPVMPVGDLSRDIWLTVTRASELTGLHADSIREACAERNGSYRGGVYIYRKNGNKYEILLNSLPGNAQNKYLENHLDNLRSQVTTVKNIESELAFNGKTTGFDFTFYNAMADSYAQKPLTAKNEAERRLKIIDEYNELLRLKISKTNAKKAIKERYPDVSDPTLWRWCCLVKDHPHEYWLPLLAPKYEGRQREEIPQKAWDYFLKYYLSEAQPAAIVVYRQTLNAAVAGAWGDIPSCKTFERRISTDLHENILIAGREGKTALKESLPHAKQDFTKRPLHHTWEADGRRCDVWVQMPNGEVHRLWLVVIRELRTRFMIGFKVGVNNDAALVSAALIHALKVTKTRPQFFHFDNGTEYSNNMLTGGQKSEVRRKDEKNKAIGFLTRLGIKVKWATPRHGAAKAIESSWNGFAENVDKTFGQAYVGRNPVERPESSDKKHAVPLAEFEQKTYQHILNFCTGAYGAHRGQGMSGKSPYELYQDLLPEYLSSGLAREVTDFEINSLRPSFQRTLSRQMVFSITIPNYGALEYEAIDNGKLKRGHQYSVLLNPLNYNDNALVYDGGKPVGQAKIKYAVDYSVEHDQDFEPVRRARIIKNTKQELSIIKNGFESLPVLTNQPLLLPLDTPLDLLLVKPPKPQPLESEVKALSDGSLVNTLTGNVVKPIEPDLSMFFDNESNVERLSEIEKKRNQKLNDTLPEWAKQNTN